METLNGRFIPTLRSGRIYITSYVQWDIQANNDKVNNKVDSTFNACPRHIKETTTKRGKRRPLDFSLRFIDSGGNGDSLACFYVSLHASE